MHDTPRTLLAAAAFALLAAPCTAGAQALLLVSELGCAQDVRVSSRGATLSQVLQRMSQTLGFELHYWARDDPPVHLEMRRPAREVMAAVSARANLIVHYKPNPRCRAEYRIAAVWVLATGDAVAAVAPAAPPASANDGYNDGYNEYMQAHGVIAPRPSASAPGGG